MKVDRPDVICATETCLSNEISSNITNLWHIFTLDRDRHGCGVLAYVFPAKNIRAGSNDLELIVISFSCKHLLLVFYRPPSSAVNIFDRLWTQYFSRFVLVGGYYFFTNSFLYMQLELCLLPFNLSQLQLKTNLKRPWIPLKSLSSCDVIPPLGNSDHNGLLIRLRKLSTTLQPSNPELWKSWL